MTRKKTENRLSSGQPPFNGAAPDDAPSPLSGREGFRKIHRLDAGLENQIKAAMKPQPLPANLRQKIDVTLDHARDPFRIPRTKIWGLVVGIWGLLLIVFFTVFNTFPPPRFENLQELRSKAVLRHIKGDTTMSFTADNLDEALDMLSRELAFKVILPELSHKGFILLGGRICSVGECRTAYLFYAYRDKLCSLFIMDGNRLNFEMADGSRFNDQARGYRTDIWKEKGQIYAMVY